VTVGVVYGLRRRDEDVRIGEQAGRSEVERRVNGYDVGRRLRSQRVQTRACTRTAVLLDRGAAVRRVWEGADYPQGVM
jgi:hypothetical protein